MEFWGDGKVLMNDFSNFFGKNGIFFYSEEDYSLKILKQFEKEIP